jgi:hypothetical protein
MVACAAKSSATLVWRCPLQSTRAAEGTQRQYFASGQARRQVRAVSPQHGLGDGNVAQERRLSLVLVADRHQEAAVTNRAARAKPIASRVMAYDTVGVDLRSAWQARADAWVRWARSPELDDDF